MISTSIAFETNAFAATREVWRKASDYLGLGKDNVKFKIKRLSPNKVQILTLRGDIFAEFSASLKGNKKLWTLQ